MSVLEVLPSSVKALKRRIHDQKFRMHKGNFVKALKRRMHHLSMMYLCSVFLSLVLYVELKHHSSDQNALFEFQKIIENGFTLLHIIRDVTRLQVWYDKNNSHQITKAPFNCVKLMHNKASIQI